MTSSAAPQAPRPRPRPTPSKTTGTRPRSDDTPRINVASRAGISITCECAAAGQKKLYITWDFSKANPELVNEDLIKALLKCLEKTAGKSIGLYSKFIAAEKFPEFRKLIEKRFPPQTEQQLKEDSP